MISCKSLQAFLMYLSVHFNHIFIFTQNQNPLPAVSSRQHASVPGGPWRKCSKGSARTEKEEEEEGERHRVDGELQEDR